MPVTHLIDPRAGNPVSLDVAEEYFEAAGLLPRAATAAIVRGLKGVAQTNVRPSDVVPNLVCRRQVVYEATRSYGVNPLAVWAMLEGTSTHSVLQTEEVRVPREGRLEVCGVPMSGRIDFDGTQIQDIKTKSPYWSVHFPSKAEKASGIRSYAKVWEPEDESGDHVFQLSIYGILRGKDTGTFPVEGVVWRLYRGLKASGPTQAWKRIKVKLLTEEQMEAKVGPWMRTLQTGLELQDAAKMPPDGRSFVSERKGQWKCNDCPFKMECEAVDGSCVRF